jgi:transposase
MSVQPQESWPIPEETQRIARAAFPKGNLYMRLRDELGEIYADSQFADLFPAKGQPAESPGRLALITIMQFAEGLSDRQTAEAVRARIDWKYALGLELTDPGFDFSVLSEFRTRMLQNERQAHLLDRLLDVLKQRGWLKARMRQRTDSTYVLAAIRTLNRLELVGETMRQALNALAQAEPDWLRQVAPPDWFPRYAQRFDLLRLPKKPAERQQLIETIGRDGMTLLEAVRRAPPGDGLRTLPAVELLRQMWLQQFWLEEGDEGHYHLHLRQDENQPPGDQRLHSPYDPEARYSAKNATEWVGYKVHLTETCEEETPHLITHVETTNAVVQDVDMAETIHAALEAKGLPPSEHLMDGGYIDADLLVAAQRDFGIEVIGPVKKDVRWQAQAQQGYSLADFTIDWTAKRALCPQGQVSTVWSERQNAYGLDIVEMRFPASACGTCTHRELCTRSKRGVRSIVARPQAQHEAIQQNRQAQTTHGFWKRYAPRSGIEGTLSQGIRGYDLRRTRYLGLVKTNLQNFATAAAINLHRVFDWLEEVPHALTRISAFAQLAPEPSLVPAGWRF